MKPQTSIGAPATKPKAERFSTVTIKQRDLYHGRYYRTGGSYAIAIPPDVREMMGFLPGEHVVMNVSHGILWVARITTQVVFPREKITAIFDQVFAEKKTPDGQHS